MHIKKLLMSVFTTLVVSYMNSDDEVCYELDIFCFPDITDLHVFQHR